MYAVLFAFDIRKLKLDSLICFPFVTEIIIDDHNRARRREEKLRKQREKRLLGLGIPQWEIDQNEATDNPELGAIELEEKFLKELEKKMGITKAYESKEDDFLAVGGGIFGGTGRADDPDKILGEDGSDDESAPLISKGGGDSTKEDSAPLISKDDEEPSSKEEKVVDGGDGGDGGNGSDDSDSSESSESSDGGETKAQEGSSGVHL